MRRRLAQETTLSIKVLKQKDITDKCYRTMKRYSILKEIRENMRKRLGDEGHYSYQMIGECYLHGMMDGEAMLCQNEGDGTKPLPSVVFEIR